MSIIKLFNEFIKDVDAISIKYWMDYNAEMRNSGNKDDLSGKKSGMIYGKEKKDDSYRVISNLILQSFFSKQLCCAM